MNGSAQCQRCKSEVDLSELRSGLCRACWDEIKTRNAGKPKPRGVAKTRPAEMARPADDQVLSLLAAGIKVSGTENAPSVSDPVESTTGAGNKVPGTTSQSYDIDNKPTSEKSHKVPETIGQSLDIDDIKTISEDGHKVPGTAFDWQSRMAEDLALALRRIKVLEEQIQKLAPLIKKEESKRDSEGMKNLRDELFTLLQKSPQGGAYISSLHGPHGNKGGLLGISKTQAFRLRDMCRMDDRFRVMKAENQSAKWIIILNQTIK